MGSYAPRLAFKIYRPAISRIVEDALREEAMQFVAITRVWTRLGNSDSYWSLTVSKFTYIALSSPA